MKYKKIDKKQQEKIVAEYLMGNDSCHEIEINYGVPIRTIQYWVRKYRKDHSTLVLPKVIRRKQWVKKMPDDVKQLQEELNKTRLHNLLLEELLDIGKEEYGIDLRKKTGAKQS